MLALPAPVRPDQPGDLRRHAQVDAIDGAPVPYATARPAGQRAQYRSPGRPRRLGGRRRSFDAQPGRDFRLSFVAGHRNPSAASPRRPGTPAAARTWPRGRPLDGRGRSPWSACPAPGAPHSWFPLGGQLPAQQRGLQPGATDAGHGRQADGWCLAAVHPLPSLADQSRPGAGPRGDVDGDGQRRQIDGPVALDTELHFLGGSTRGGEPHPLMSRYLPAVSPIVRSRRQIRI